MLAFAGEYAPAHICWQRCRHERTDQAGGATPHAVQPVAAARQDAAVPGRPARLRRRCPRFNPIYGQGMSVAALDAVGTAGDVAARCHEPAGGTFVPRRKAIGVAWQIAAGSDLAFPEVEGRRTTAMRVSNRFVEWVLTACESDIRSSTSSSGSPVLSIRPRACSVTLHRQGREGQSASSAT